MSLLVDDALESKLLETMIPGRGRVPDDPAPGNYVVVDVAQFSTTVPELFANGFDGQFVRSRTERLRRRGGESLSIHE